MAVQQLYAGYRTLQAAYTAESTGEKRGYHRSDTGMRALLLSYFTGAGAHLFCLKRIFHGFVSGRTGCRNRAGAPIVYGPSEPLPRV